MVTIHLHQTTTATPGQFLAGLTDRITMTTTGKRFLGQALAKTAEAIEARNDQTTPGNSAKTQ